MTNQEIKSIISDALFDRSIWTRRVDSSEIRTRCPFCGDSVHSDNTGHLYIRINVDDNLPMIYHCFRCEESGIITNDTLSLLDVEVPDIKEMLNQVNSTSDKIKKGTFSTNDKILFFEYKLPEVYNNKYKLGYIEKRLGIKFDTKGLEKCKIITSLKDFLLENDITTLGCETYMAEKLEDHYIGFLSFGSSYILFRDVTDRENIRWFKYPITKESKESRCFYSMSSNVDILSTDPININLTEGVFDILSAYYNLSYNTSNDINIAVCGKGYSSILEYLVSIGIVGGNITVNIFSDNDAVFNKKAKVSTNVKFYKKAFSKLKYLFKEINVYYNLKSKDIGVIPSEITLQKYKI